MCTKESKMNYKFDGSKVYFTSDTHFYHSNIIGFCKRPFKNVEDMNETLIENWNRVVGQDDIVFHLGDFCMGGSHEWTKILNRLNGKIACSCAHWTEMTGEELHGANSHQWA